MNSAVEYDCVVVGAGTAGGVRAARLSGDGVTHVLPVGADGPGVPEATPLAPAWPRSLPGVRASEGLRAAGASTGPALRRDDRATVRVVAEPAADSFSPKGAW